LDSLDKEKEINDLQEFSLLSSSMNLDILPNPVCIVQENSMRFSFGNLKFFEYFALSEDSYGKVNFFEIDFFFHFLFSFFF